jgi:hypothetical protein
MYKHEVDDDITG